MAQPVEIKPHLYSVTRAANIFILQTGPDSLALIDAGIPRSTRTVLTAVRALGFAPTAVKHILVTHADIDHVGSLRQLADATGATVVAHELSVPYIERALPPPHLAGVMGVVARGFQRLTQRKATVDHVVRDGDWLDIGGGIRVLHAPGHTPDNVCYYWESEDVLFAPDLLNRFDVLLLTPPNITWDMTQAKASARRVLALEAGTICVGHGEAWRAERDSAELDALLKTLA
jgi:glyoxylase-like metal-dependent hydrolase (beta-lactamase superfamily II)